MKLPFRRSKGEQRMFNDFWSHDAEPPGSRFISVEQATHLGPVFAALRHIVDFVSTLPVCAYRMNPDGTSTQLGSLPNLFSNQELPGMQGIEQFVGQAVFGIVAHGNSVGWILETDGYGFPTDIRWLRSIDWHYDWVGAQWYVRGQPVPASRVFHIPWLVPPGWTIGMSPIEHYATLIRAGLSAQEYADVRRGGGLPPAVLKNTRKPKLTDPSTGADQSEYIREAAVAAFRTGKPFVTGSDWDLTALSIPPNHAQFIETLRLTADQIAGIYGIDARECGGGANDSMNYSTDESYALKRAGNLRPYVVRLEKAFARALPGQQYVKFDMDETIRADQLSRAQVEDIRIKNGSLTVNEARAMEDLPPLPGGDKPTPALTAAPAVPTPEPDDRPANGATDG